MDPSASLPPFEAPDVGSCSSSTVFQGSEDLPRHLILAHSIGGPELQRFVYGGRKEVGRPSSTMVRLTRERLVDSHQSRIRLHEAEAEADVTPQPGSRPTDDHRMVIWVDEHGKSDCPESNCKHTFAEGRFFNSTHKEHPRLHTRPMLPQRASLYPKHCLSI
ncbi:hypothetical protein BU23DRAFT_81092 [Bimuria novae-zelandiae CBS 107.79]|uniref:Uncharacterized protein n=1 Tax=Bimuria novae-zelandiae CBS 107.79 TaxID=1447943 RepID=A0A6A5VJX6_9PLEO|nr:hypothetical protein BU23DRAFT_81092 [Bimuria novae-zelandiae CBS 107.79]